MAVPVKPASAGDPVCKMPSVPVIASGSAFSHEAEGRGGWQSSSKESPTLLSLRAKRGNPV